MHVCFIQMISYGFIYWANSTIFTQFVSLLDKNYFMCVRVYISAKAVNKQRY